MRISDFVFRFKHDADISNAGVCRVRIFVNSQMSTYVVLTELDCNPSASVTNAISSIHHQLLSAKLIPQTSKIIEHYPGSKYSAELFLLVDFSPCYVPSETPLTYSTILNLLECDKDEFGYKKTPYHIQKGIRDALDGIPPIETFEYIEDPRITERRLQIRSNQRKIEDLKSLLSTNPSERHLSFFSSRICH